MFYFPYLKKLQSLIEKIQRGFTKRICPHGLSYSQRLQLLSDVSVEHRYKISLLLYMYNFLVKNSSINGFEYTISNLPARRSVNKIIVLHCKTNLRKSFNLIRHISLWNSLNPNPSNMSSTAAVSRFLTESVPDSLA